MAEDRTEKILRLYSEVKATKADFAAHLEDIAVVMLPRRSGFTGINEPEGSRLYDEIFDSTPQQAARALASAIGTSTRPDGEQWFFMMADDDALNQSEEALMWFDQVQRLMMKRAFDNPQSRFRQSMAEADLDLVVFGTACMFIGERRDISGMNYKTEPLKDVFIVTDENNSIDGIIFRWNLNARQARAFFKDKAGPGIKELEDQANFKNKVEHIHVVLPRDERGIGGVNTNMPYSSIWIEVEKKALLTESGFMEFPFVVPRFDTTSGEDWGRGPGMMALPDSNMLQAMDETIITAGQKAVEPPILAPDDGSFNAANTFPGGLTYYDAELAREMGRIPIVPLETGANLAIGLEMQQDRRIQVEKAFFKHVMNLPVDGPEMTATEVIRRDQEFMREMGGLFGRLDTEYISPVVLRTFNVMMRAGVFPEIPEILQGAEVNFQYESPLKKVRQQIEAAAARQWKDDLMMMSEVKPEVLDVINADAYARMQAEANSVPMTIMNDSKTIEATRKQRAEQQQQQLQMEQLMQGAGAGGDAAGALKQLSEIGANDG